MYPPAISERGSSATGHCSNVSDSGRECSTPRSSVLLDGIPTLTGLDGDMWATQLLTLNTSTSSSSITFDFNTVFDTNAVTTYTGVELIEIVMFNCLSMDPTVFKFLVIIMIYRNYYNRTIL